MQTVDPKICSILIFGNSFSTTFFENVEKEKCSSCYTILPDQSSLCDCLYLLRYWAICALQHVLVSQVEVP